MLSFEKIENALTRENFLWLCKRYKHFLWALIVPVFIAVFLISSEYHVPELYYSSYIALDDYIPFVPPFILAYFSWFPMLGFIGVYHLVTDSAAYKRYIWALMIGMFLIQTFYFIVPNGQDLRIPMSELPDNIFGRMIRSLWKFDSNRDVLPSMHVYACMIMEISVIDSRYMRKPALIIPLTIINIFVVASTVLIKQHSILDIFTSLIPAAILFFAVYVIIKKRQKPNTLEKVKRTEQND